MHLGLFPFVYLLFIIYWKAAWITINGWLWPCTNLFSYFWIVIQFCSVLIVIVNSRRLLFQIIVLNLCCKNLIITLESIVIRLFEACLRKQGLGLHLIVHLLLSSPGNKRLSIRRTEWLRHRSCIIFSLPHFLIILCNICLLH